MVLQYMRTLHDRLRADVFIQPRRPLLTLLVVLFGAVLWANAGTFDGPAELPRVFINSSMSTTPAVSKVVSLSAGQSLQTALDHAVCGETIQLQAGATFPGAFTLPAKNCDNQHWIVIRTSAPDSALPPEGKRVTPCYAGISSLPARPSFGCSSPKKVLAKVVYTGRGASGPMGLAPGANHYRFVGLEITRAAGLRVDDLVFMRYRGTGDHIIVDRCWLHGTTHDDTSAGIHFTGITYGAVVDSYFSDFHCTAVTGICTDSHSVGGGGGTSAGGPYKIVNNFLEAAGENIMFGGAKATMTPTDIEIRRNHIFKPMIWMPGWPGFVAGVSGYPFVVKNHFELKNAVRVLFEGNILENSWGGFTQRGFSILLTPTNQGSDGLNLCPICQVTDVTIRYNKISHTGAGFQIATSLSSAGGMALAGERFSIHDITVDDINANKYRGSGAFALVGNSWSVNPLSHVSFNHITAFPDPTARLISLKDLDVNPMMGPFTFLNSIAVSGSAAVYTAGGGPSNCAFSGVPVISLGKCFTAYTFNHNALINVPATFPPSEWPTGNDFPSSISMVQFVNANNGNGGDYHLKSTSPYKNAATDGKDMGADIDAILAATAGVY